MPTLKFVSVMLFPYISIRIIHKVGNLLRALQLLPLMGWQFQVGQSRIHPLGLISIHRPLMCSKLLCRH